MRRSKDLNELELHVLSAIERLHPNARVPTVLDDLKKQTGRTTSARTLYAILSRLQRRGMVTFQTRQPGRSPKVIAMSAAGSTALQSAAAGRARVGRLVRAILDGPNPGR